MWTSLGGLSASRRKRSPPSEERFFGATRGEGTMGRDLLTSRVIEKIMTAEKAMMAEKAKEVRETTSMRTPGDRSQSMCPFLTRRGGWHRKRWPR